MTKSDLIKYLGTIAKSQTSEFFNKVQEAQNNKDTGSMSDLIGQFGVGFYSAFLVADKVVVTSKHNDDDQHIWESDANSFITSKDPRGNTLGRGTTVSLHMKEEGAEFLEEHKLKEIITKYSQFITFNIYLWTSKSVEEEVPIEETETATKAPESDDDATVEEAKTEEKPKTKKVTKTVYDWELMNSAKPIWQRKASDITDDEYRQFYKAFSKDTQDYLTSTHFSAEGEVSFKSILFVPKIAPSDIFQNYNKPSDNSLKLYVRRVFISDNVDDLVPKYLSFIRGIVDSDDLPLNVSRETLQQSKLLKVIKKKIVRKILDMIKKLSEEDFATFWKEYGTNIKLGVIEDNSNKNRLSHLLRFHSSNDDTKLTSLDEYMKRMKTDQANIFFIAGTNKDALAKSPFVERILKKGYEVLYCVDPIDEYTLQSIPEFEGKRLQNVAKDGLKLDKSKAAEDRQKELETAYAPLVSWIKEGSLKQFVENVKVSSRLVQTPMALVASQYGYSGNMERITRAQAYQKSGGDSTQHHFASQKKILEINPGHPLIKELLKLVEGDANSQRADDLVNLMFEAATIRSGYELRDTAGFADRIETMMRSALNISPDEKVDEMPDFDESVAEEAAQEQPDEVNADEEPEVKAEVSF
jgi:heat shock protein beta